MKNCFKFETMQSETKIKEAIYKVLRREIENEDGFSFGTDLSEVATEIAAAIAPHLEEPDFPFSKLFDHMSNEHGLTLLDTELDDIIHIARGK
jgi:hypothetical protein